jgi:ACS family hexuronate transporter-like MFS transporter
MTIAAISSSPAERSLRWKMAFLVSSAIAISYLDRQTLPVAIKAIEQDIPLSAQGFAFLQSAFLVAYAVMYAGGGWLLDFLGTRVGFILIMVFWSLACASHSLAMSFAMLLASRLLLGMGEGGAFPAATRVVSEWFPAKESSTAMGIINAGTAVGAVAAPPLIALVLIYANWRWIFILTGLLGLLWTLWWRATYYPPGEAPSRKSPGGQPFVVAHLQPGEIPAAKPDWLSLLRFPQVWGMLTAKFLSDAAWYFYLFWLPKYLYDARGFDIKAVGSFAWIPYAASGVGCLCGGWFSSWLLQRQFSLNLSRKLALGASAIVMPCVLLIQHVPVGWALALFSVAYFGQQSWSTLVMILPTDLFPVSAVGSVAGLVGFGGAMGGVVFGQVAGYLLDHGFGYGPVFMLAGSFHLIAFVILLIAIPTVKRLTWDTI